jgi:hypothetical protein
VLHRPENLDQILQSNLAGAVMIEVIERIPEKMGCLEKALKSTAQEKIRSKLLGQGKERKQKR